MIRAQLKRLQAAYSPQKPFTGVDEAAHDDVHANFWRILSTYVLTKLADTLASTKIVLPWLLNSAGVPTFFSGLLVPIRESGSMIPQVLMGGYLQRFRRRKVFYVLGNLVQAAAIALIAIAALFMEGRALGFTVIGLIAVFSLARGICSISAKDVLAKTVPEGSRGRLSGLSASVAGFIGILVGCALIAGVKFSGSSAAFLLFLAVIAWLAASWVYARIVEPAGESAEQEGLRQRVRDSFHLLRCDPVFRHFVITRALLMSSALSAPYLVLLAQQDGAEHSLGRLGLFFLVSGIASFVSGPVWGALADWSSRSVMQLSGSITAFVCLCAATASFFIDNLSTEKMLGAGLVLYFILSIAHQGVRLGRKTYVVDIAEGNQQTDYVSVSNSLIGLLLLITGVFSAVAAEVSLAVVLIIFSLMSIAAVITCRKLPEAQH